MTDSLIRLRDALREFAAAREWEQFHSPRNLATALAVEAAELLEPFQWLTDEESRNLAPEKRAAAGQDPVPLISVFRTTHGCSRIERRPMLRCTNIVQVIDS